MLALLAVACGGDNDHPTCTLIGCEAVAAFDLGAFPESDFAQLTDARVEVCFNGACRDQLDRHAAAAGRDDGGLVSATTDPIIIKLALWRTDPSGVIQIPVELDSVHPELFHDGDIYAITLVGSDGAPLVNRTWSINYQDSNPNGPDCGTCRSTASMTEL